MDTQSPNQLLSNNGIQPSVSHLVLGSDVNPMGEHQEQVQKTSHKGVRKYTCKQENCIRTTANETQFCSKHTIKPRNEQQVQKITQQGTRKYTCQHVDCSKTTNNESQFCCYHDPEIRKKNNELNNQNRLKYYKYQKRPSKQQLKEQLQQLLQQQLTA